MLDILDFMSDVLPPTRTYKRRSWCFVPADRRHPEADGRLGNLSIKLQHSKSGVRRVVECDTYAVSEDTPEPGDHGGRAFWFYNLTDQTQERPYRCVVGGLTPHCDCTAGQCRVAAEEGMTEGCKHRDGILAVIAAGCLDYLSEGATHAV